MARIRFTALCFFGVAALALASCGSSKKSTTQSTATTPTAKLTAAELAKKGDAICKRGTAQIIKLKQPKGNLANPTASQLKAVGPFLSGQATVIRTEVAQIQALGPPTDNASGFAKAVAAGSAVATTYQAAAQAAASGNLKTYKVTIAKLNQVGPASGAATKAFGFKVCGQQRG